MRKTVAHTIELILGVLLIGLGLLYLLSQNRTLTGLRDIISLQIIEDKKVYQQYYPATTMLISDEDLYASLMGYREYPIMIDDNIIPLKGQDYELYFTYIRTGSYRKEYQYDAYRNIEMIVYTYMGL